MKIRTGFVSNSSSSSFLICLAKINDMEKFLKYVEERRLTISKESPYDIPMLTSTSKISERKYYDIAFKNNKIVLESFRGDEVALKINPQEDENILVLNFTGNEGDSSYPFESADGDIDYDVIDKDYFTELGYLFDLGEEQGVSEIHYQLGAARNG